MNTLPARMEGAFSSQNIDPGLASLGFSIDLSSTGLTHIEGAQRMSGYICDICGKVFSRSTTRKDHMEAVHGNVTYSCACGRVYKYQCGFRQHRQKCSLAVGTKPTKHVHVDLLQE